MTQREHPSRPFATLPLLVSLLSPQARAATEGYVLGVFPFLASARLEEVFAPLSARLGAEIGVPVGYRSAADFDRFARALQEARFDFVFVQPFDYIRFAAPAGYRPIAKMGEPLEGIFVVRPDSAARSLSDLRGKRLGLPPPQAAVSLLARSELEAEDLMPVRDLSVDHHLTHDACLQALVARDVDACVTAENPLVFFEAASGYSLRRLAVTESIPSPLFAAHDRVSSAHVEKVRKQLLDRGFVREVIPFFTQGLEEAKDADYAPVRARWRQVQEREAGPLVKLVFGVHPFLPIPRLDALFAPLMPAIERAARLPVQLRTASSVDRFIANLEIGRYDIAALQPFDFALIAEPIGWVPLVKHDAGHRAVFFVHPDAPEAKLADLRGKSLAVLPPHSAVSRLGICMLRAAGLEPGRDVEIREVSGHDACLEALAARRVAACVSASSTPEVLGFAGAFRTIATSDEELMPLIAAHPRVPVVLRDQLAEALAAWPSGQDRLVENHLGSFALTNPEDFALARRMASGICPGENGSPPSAGD